MGKNILITGASGLVGTRLTEILVQAGHRVSHVGRRKANLAVPEYIWDINRGIIDPQALASAEVIIHLAGAGVADRRWTARRKREILRSRVDSTGLLFNALEKGSHGVKTIVSASAIGYYGFADVSEIFSETHPAGSDFLAQVCEQWENEIEKIRLLNVRVAKIRIGIVLSNRGGALPSMAMPIKLGFGAPIAPGSQWISWIHVDDLCQIFRKAVEDDAIRGAYNAVAPEPVTNKEMTQILARVLKRPLWLPPIPRFVMRVIFGEMADVVTHGNRISPEKVLKTGFSFQFASLEGALQQLYAI